MKIKYLIFSLFIVANVLVSVVFAMSPGYNSKCQSSVTEKPQLKFSTFYGGGDEDFATAVCYDDDQNIYAAGNTQSFDIPLKNSIVDKKINSIDVFIAKFSSSGELLRSTYFGGSGDDKAEAMCIDNSGRIYVAGSTTSADLPVTEGAFQKKNSGIWDAYVICFSENLENIIYCTYIGGELSDSAHDITVGDECCAYITGITSSLDFPVTEDVFQAGNNGRREAYVLKLNPRGDGVISSTYFGGIGDDYGEGIAIDKSENVYITGYTYSSKTRSLPVKNSAYGPSPYSYDAYCASFDRNLSELIFSTYIGGGSGDRGTDIFVSDEETVCLTGYTYSKDFPVKNPYQGNFSGGKYCDAYIMSLSKDGSDVLFSTFLGGEKDDFSYEINCDADGRIIISGGTSSEAFPLTESILPDDCFASDTKTDSFISIFGEDGALMSSVRLGGRMYDYANCFATDGCGNITIAGKTESEDFPVKNADCSRFSGGNFDMFLTGFSIAESEKDNMPSQMSGNCHILLLTLVLALMYVLKRS